MSKVKISEQKIPQIEDSIEKVISLMKSERTPLEASNCEKSILAICGKANVIPTNVPKIPRTIKILGIMLLLHMMVMVGEYGVQIIQIQ